MVLLVSLYLWSVLLFSVTDSVVGYCGILVFNSLCSMLIICGFSGFSWYALLLYLVYVGGVYVLFIFLSVFLPNSLGGFHFSFLGGFVWFMIVWEFAAFSVGSVCLPSDFSFNFCNVNEGPLYLFLCLFLLVGFGLASMIGGSKESFIR